MTERAIDASGTITIGDRTVHRLGFGAMRLTGEGIWGEPDSPDEAVRVLRRAVELGVDFIDTADSYGPAVSEELIAEALHPYPDHLTIATKAGLERPGPGEWVPNGRPEHIREACDGSLGRLKLEQIPLYQLHRIDPQVPAEDSIGTLLDLQKAGKIAHIGLSEVTEDQLTRVREMTRASGVTVASVQNRYNLADRQWSDVLKACEAEGTAFIPFFPIGSGDLGGAGQVLDDIADAHGTSTYAIALAWLLASSEVMVPIPGTSSVAHLEQNVAAAALELSDDELSRLDAA